MVTVRLLLLVVAFVLFALAAFRVPAPVDLTAAGLACLTASFLVA